MKVRELIELLQEIDPELTVMVTSCHPIEEYQSEATEIQLGQWDESYSTEEEAVIDQVLSHS